MAESKELVVSDFSWSPEFVQELLPSAQRTALLYHLSYLHLGGFPKLEHLIREQALETQLLFGTSESVLLKCVGTSSNLVTSLFPMLMKAVEKNKPVLAVKYLEKAKEWINDIIRSVDDIVKRYDQQNHSVATCTSDVFKEQKMTEDKPIQRSKEVKRLEIAVANLEEDLRENAEYLKKIKKRIKRKNSEMQNYIMDVPRKTHSILVTLVPFVRVIFRFFYNPSNPRVNAKAKALDTELSRLTSEKQILQNKEYTIQVKLTDLQLKLASYKIKWGVIPSPVHLTDVQQCLSQIQQILVQLQKFWEKVGAALDTLKKKTFVGEDLIDNLDDLKEEFLNSIEIAEKYWSTFGAGCQRASGIFSIQSKDAYKFLETSPSSLSEAEWKKQYDSVMEKLNQISLQESCNAAITELNDGREVRDHSKGTGQTRETGAQFGWRGAPTDLQTTASPPKRGFPQEGSIPTYQPSSIYQTTSSYKPSSTYQSSSTNQPSQKSGMRFSSTKREFY